VTLFVWSPLYGQPGTGTTTYDGAYAAAVSGQLAGAHGDLIAPQIIGGKYHQEWASRAAAFRLHRAAFPMVRRITVVIGPPASVPVDFARITVSTHVPDRNAHLSGGHDVTLVDFTQGVPLSMPPINAIRSTLHYAIEHELDECIYADGERPFDPHRGAP
jgi:hypothetical protein